WLNPEYKLRKIARELLPSLCRYSPEMIDMGIPLMLGNFNEENLWSVLERELKRPEVLDGFVKDTLGKYRAYGPGVTTHICAGNIPGVSITSIVYALLSKSANFIKLSSGDPLFPVLFIQSLIDVEPVMGKCFAACWWDYSKTALTENILNNSDLVVAYGTEDTIKTLKEKTQCGFIGYGNKISFGVISCESLFDYHGLAKLIAQDVAIFDQQGCLSPHLYYVETGGKISPVEFAGHVAAALEEMQKSIPVGSFSMGEAAQIQQIRGAVEFRKISGKPVELWTSPHGVQWTVFYEENPEFQLSCLNRVVWIKPVTNIETIPELLEPWKLYLQTIGVAIPEKRLIPFAEEMGRLGVNRFCPIGKMQSPGPGWHHDGFPSISHFLRWVDIEE
ncbi:MAG: hypothetical protein M1426_05400, partial [Patescibacteria group bacterium]|nr:hypothetical protein [Patescibacteria group bacterium]